MHQRVDLAASWEEYELLDSGNNEKLERFGEVVLARPEPQAIWPKGGAEQWANAQATFVMQEGRGVWLGAQKPREWEVSFGESTAQLTLTNSKHIGMFPEQAPNWQWLTEQVAFHKQCAEGQEVRVLNLFGYTGMASVVMAQAGAKVTHVDASKQSVEWAKENMRLSELPEDSVRWIVDDASVFVKREAKRGNTYAGIVLDPPAFGRGAKGEVWHIAEDLPKLLSGVSDILAEKGFLLLNGYAAGYTPTSFVQLAEAYLPGRIFEYGELQLVGAQRIISEGIYVRG